MQEIIPNIQGQPQERYSFYRKIKDVHALKIAYDEINNQFYSLIKLGSNNFKIVARNERGDILYELDNTEYLGKNIQGIAVDSNSFLYVLVALELTWYQFQSNPYSHKMCKYDKDGNLIDTFDLVYDQDIQTSEGVYYAGYYGDTISNDLVIYKNKFYTVHSGYTEFAEPDGMGSWIFTTRRQVEHIGIFCFEINWDTGTKTFHKYIETPIVGWYGPRFAMNDDHIFWINTGQVTSLLTPCIIKVKQDGTFVKGVGQLTGALDPFRFTFAKGIVLDKKNRLIITSSPTDIRIRVLDLDLNYIDSIVGGFIDSPLEYANNPNFVVPEIIAASEIVVGKDNSLILSEAGVYTGVGDLLIIKNDFIPDYTPYIKSIASLLPHGYAWTWKNRLESNLYGFIKTIASSISKLDNDIIQILKEMRIDKTDVFLNEWEKLLGLPNEYIDIANTKEQRRLNLLGLIRSHVCSTKEDFIDLAKLMGFNIQFRTLDEYTAFPWVFPHMFGGNADENAFTLIITFKGISKTGSFPWTFPHVFSEDSTKYIRGLFNLIKPAYANIMYRYE